MEPWAKKAGLDEPYPLRHHLIDAAAAAWVLWEVHYSAGMRRWISDELQMSEADARRFAALLAGLHDLGKSIPCFFYESPRPGQPEWIGHDVATQLVVPTLLNPGADVWAVSAEYRIGQLLGGHHGRFHPGRERDAADPVRLEDRLGGHEWHAKRAEVVDAIQDVLGKPTLPTRFLAPTAGVLTGLVIVADWLVSDTDSFIPSQQKEAPEEPAGRWEFTVARVRDRVATLGLTAPTFVETVSTRQVWDFDPNPLQQSLLEEFAPDLTEPGLLIITDSTGGGKTEGSFLAAYAFGRVTGRTGIVDALPTRATTNEAWRRLTTFREHAAVGSPPVTMAHAMASFNDRYQDDQDVTQFLRPLNRTLLAGLCACTVDQVLLAALAAPWNMLRMHGLANKTVIIDEVHTYDPYMQGLLTTLLSWCGRLEVPVVLLSATLPDHIARNLASAYVRGADQELPDDFDVPYPGWAFAGISGRSLRPSPPMLSAMASAGTRQVRLERRPHDRNENSRLEVIRSYTQQVVASGGCVAVVCNTVESAQNTFSALADELPTEIPLLLHARLPEGDRARTTDDVLGWFGKSSVANRPTRAVLVATQVIEQSLDLDFDLVISDIAPVSLLMQRLGRCWRFTVDNDGRPIPRPAWSTGPALVVLDPVLLDSDVPTPPAWEEIYPSFEVAATHQVLVQHSGKLAVPGEVRDLVLQVHDVQASGVPQALREQWEKQYGENRARAQLARMAAIEPPEMLTDLSRLTDPDVSDMDVVTRLGMDTARLVPCYTSKDGQWLDPDHTLAWPTSRPTPEIVKRIIEASIPCPRAWAEAEELQTNPTWSRTPMLRDAFILPAPVCGRLSVDPVLGLRRQKG